MVSISEIFNQFPIFHQWVKNKKLSERDLSILTEFKNCSSIKPLLKWIENNKPTHSQGIQILDLGGELLLMDKPLNQLLSKRQKALLLIESLKKLRKPKSSAYDEEQSKIVSKLDWTNSIKAKWIRQNDRGALSIHFNSFSMKDFKQKIQKLNSIHKSLNEDSNKLWKD